MSALFIRILDGLLERLARARARRRWEKLKANGMEIGEGVEIPDSTWVDTSHCYLISIGDRSRFGEGCFLLSHDAQMDEFLDAGRLGRVVVHEDCYIGHRTTVLPGVEIGPRTIVQPQSVVSRSLPPDTVCGGSPAKVLMTLDAYVEAEREAAESLPSFDEGRFRRMAGTPSGRTELKESLAGGGFVTRTGKASS